MLKDRREFLAHLFHVAIKAVDPYHALQSHFPLPKPKGQTLVVAFGKGSLTMAKAFERLAIETDFGDYQGFVVAPHDKQV